MTIRQVISGQVSYYLSEEEDNVLQAFLQDVKLCKTISQNRLDSVAKVLTDPRAKFDPDRDQNTPCARRWCGHPYYRHFDPFEDNEPVGALPRNLVRRSSFGAEGSAAPKPI